MFNRVKYFITQGFNKTSIKESFIKNKKKYNQPNKKVSSNIIIRKYHSSNTNSSNKPPNDFTKFILCSVIVGTYFINKKIIKK
jgi:hypothetical protein